MSTTTPLNTPPIANKSTSNGKPNITTTTTTITTTTTTTEPTPPSLEEGELTEETPPTKARIFEAKSVDEIKRSWRLPSINYRLHEDKEYQRLTFEGETITAGDVCTAVAVSHNMGDMTNNKLQIINSLNKQILQETDILPKFSSVIIKKLNAARWRDRSSHRDTGWDKQQRAAPRDARERITSNRASRSRSEAAQDERSPSAKRIQVISSRVNKFKDGYQGFKKAGVQTEHHDFSLDGYTKPSSQRIITYVTNNNTKLLDTDTTTGGSRALTSPDTPVKGMHELPVAGAVTGRNGTNMYAQEWKTTSVYYPEEDEKLKTTIKLEKQ